MNRKHFHPLLTGLLLCLAWLPQAWSADTLNVFVSVLPQQYFVERIGGEHVQVQAMVQPGYSPATYEPTPRQIAALADAELYIRTGVPFENAWMQRIQSVNPDMPVMDAREGLELRQLAKHGHEHEAREAQGEHQEQDPHIWTSPRLVKQMAASIRDRLSDLRPQYRQVFAANYDTFAADLDKLDAELSQLFSQSRQRKFMVFHPSWGYLADAYGLQQIAIEHEGKEPGAKALTALIKQAKTEGVHVIFVQPQFDKRTAEQVAQAIDGTVISVDPLSIDYLDNLRAVARLIAGTGNE